MANEIASKAVDRWADNEVEAFLNIYSEDGIQGGHRNTEVYQTISLRLAQMGIYHSPKQCREKIKKLKQDYKKAKEIIQKSGGSNRRTSKWFHSLDLILGRPPLPAHSGAVVSVDDTSWNAIKDNVTVMNSLDFDISSTDEPAEQKQASVKTADKWTHSEVQSLLTIYSENDIQREFGMWRRNEKVYQKISLRLAELGIHHSSKHCRDKIKKMKQDYRRIKEQESMGDPNKTPSRPLWFEALDAILSQKSEYVHVEGTHQCETLLLEVTSDDGNSNNEQESSAEDDHSEPIHLEEQGSADSPGSCSHDPVPHPFGLLSSSHIPDQIKERIHLEEPGSIDSPGTSGCPDPVSPPPCPVTPSPCLISPSHVPEQTKRKRKRDSDLLEVMRQMEKRESVILETMQEMEEAHLDILRQELDQRERYFQMLLAHNAQEAKAREREFALRREEAAEARRQQEAFQQGFLAALTQLVQVLDKKDSPVMPPLD
ncbi:hypothetical protein ACEWY4_022882 [Coilia grayii]|uniref:Myb/SANT-like DNA-binding domain-containing protein n=1 Tax=Coilia grayii TaxID=363190 RepID=A0ABD1J1H3_9TELE